MCYNVRPIDSPPLNDYVLCTCILFVRYQDLVWGMSSLTLSRAYMNNTRRNGQSRISSTTDYRLHRSAHKHTVTNTLHRHTRIRCNHTSHTYQSYTTMQHIQTITILTNRSVYRLFTVTDNHSYDFRTLAHRHAVHTRPFRIDI